MSFLHRFLALLFLVTPAAIGAQLLTAPEALAGPIYQAVDSDNDPYSGIYLRNGTSMTNVTRDAAHYILYGTSLDLQCGTWGEAVGPYANRRWHWVRVVNGSIAGTYGWIADRYVNTPNAANQLTPGEPECGSTPTVPAGTYVTQSTAIRYCVDLAAAGCQVAGPTIGANTPVTMQCWKDSSGSRWFYVQSSSGVVGFVAAGLVGHQTTVGACSGNPRVTASEVAASRYNEQWARSADLALFAASEWSPGPVGEWAGDCPKLPFVGWKAAGFTIRKSDAISNYRAYANAGLIRTDSNPPAGAVVFYNITSWGHTAVSLGNGMVATTRGLDKSYERNAIVPRTTFANYLGYYLPA